MVVVALLSLLLLVLFCVVVVAVGVGAGAGIVVVDDVVVVGLVTVNTRRWCPCPRSCRYRCLAVVAKRTHHVSDRPQQLTPRLPPQSSVSIALDRREFPNTSDENPARKPRPVRAGTEGGDEVDLPRCFPSNRVRPVLECGRRQVG